MSDKIIPDEAVEAACLAMNDGVWSSHHRDRWGPEVDTILTAAAPIVVAAYLTRIADSVDTVIDPAADAWIKAEFCGKREVVGALRAHAAVLRGVSGVSADGGEKTDE